MFITTLCVQVVPPIVLECVVNDHALCVLVFLLVSYMNMPLLIVPCCGMKRALFTNKFYMSIFCVSSNCNALPICVSILVTVNCIEISQNCTSCMTT